MTSKYRRKQVFKSNTGHQGSMTIKIPKPHTHAGLENGIGTHGHCPHCGERLAVGTVVHTVKRGNLHRVNCTCSECSPS